MKACVLHLIFQVLMCALFLKIHICNYLNIVTLTKDVY